MPDAIWIDRDDELQAFALRLSRPRASAVDTEFLREKTFFPQLCLLQIAAGGDVWCIDASARRLGALVPALTATGDAQAHPRGPTGSRGVLSDQQARGHAGLRHARSPPAAWASNRRSGYADLVHRPTRRHLEQGPYPHGLVEAAVERRASGVCGRRRALSRRTWRAASPRTCTHSAASTGSIEDCAALEDVRGCSSRIRRALASGYAASTSSTRRAARSRQGASRVARAPGARSRSAAIWVLSDAAIFEIAHANPADARRARGDCAESQRTTMRASPQLARHAVERSAPTATDGDEPRPSRGSTDAEQKALIEPSEHDRRPARRRTGCLRRGARAPRRRSRRWPSASATSPR